MPEGDGVIYNGFKEYTMEGVFNLASGGDTLQMTLHTGYTPDIDVHDEWADAGVSTTEYSPGSGYSADGVVLGGQDVTRETTFDRGEYDANDALFSALGPLSPAIPSHTINWDHTPTSPADPLICYWVLGTTPTNGGDYTLVFGTNGLILLT